MYNPAPLPVKERHRPSQNRSPSSLSLLLLLSPWPRLLLDCHRAARNILQKKGKISRGNGSPPKGEDSALTATKSPLPEAPSKLPGPQPKRGSPGQQGLPLFGSVTLLQEKIRPYFYAGLPPVRPDLCRRGAWWLAQEFRCRRHQTRRYGLSFRYCQYYPRRSPSPQDQ
jgi:hypothetical protein